MNKYFDQLQSYCFETLYGQLQCFRNIGKTFKLKTTIFVFIVYLCFESSLKSNSRHLPGWLYTSFLTEIRLQPPYTIYHPLSAITENVWVVHTKNYTFTSFGQWRLNFSSAITSLAVRWIYSAKLPIKHPWRNEYGLIYKVNPLKAVLWSWQYNV